VHGEHRTGSLGVSQKGAIEKPAVFVRGDGAPKDDGNHLVAQILVEHAGVQVQQRLRPARLD
jgi:hypothetical protein